MTFLKWVYALTTLANRKGHLHRKAALSGEKMANSNPATICANQPLISEGYVVGVFTPGAGSWAGADLRQKRNRVALGIILLNSNKVPCSVSEESDSFCEALHRNTGVASGLGPRVHLARCPVSDCGQYRMLQRQTWDNLPRTLELILLSES